MRVSPIERLGKNEIWCFMGNSIFPTPEIKLKYVSQLQFGNIPDFRSAGLLWFFPNLHLEKE